MRERKRENGGPLKVRLPLMYEMCVDVDLKGKRRRRNGSEGVKSRKGKEEIRNRRGGHRNRAVSQLVRKESRKEGEIMRITNAKPGR